MNDKTKLHTFNIDYTSKMESGKNYQGSFTSKKLSILDQTKISRRKSELCGGMYTVRDDDGKPTGQGIDEVSEWTSNMIAILEVAIISSPPWWDLKELVDDQLMMDVFKEVMEFENSFRGRGRSEDTRDGSDISGEESSQRQHQKSNNSDNAPKMVDEEIPITLDA